MKHNPETDLESYYSIDDESGFERWKNKIVTKKNVGGGRKELHVDFKCGHTRKHTKFISRHTTFCYP